MACSNCNQSAPNTKCGCQDQPITAAFNPTPNTSCPDPTPCYETIQDTCVKHSNEYSIYLFGYHLSDGSPYPVLPAGASLENAYQAMSSHGVDAQCLPPINLHPSYIGTNSIVLSWEDTGADYYYINSGTIPFSWVTSPALSQTTYTLTSLSSNTNYYFQVVSFCNSSGTNSVGAIIIVKTL